ncbi:hypothetical protein Tco_1229136 [Tanacetum coccineum]
MKEPTEARGRFEGVGFGAGVVAVVGLSLFVVSVSDLWVGMVETIVFSISSMMVCDGVPAESNEKLVGQMNEACQDRISFVRELKSVAGVANMTNTVVFLTEMMNKKGFREWQLRDLEKKARERTLEIEMIV